MSRVGWVDASMGVSGDMLLGALSDAGAFADGSDQRLLASLPFAARVSATPVDVAGLRAMAIEVTAAAEQPDRRLADVLAVVESADAPVEVRARAAAVFTRLAAAEAAVHGIATNDVHFHEVGAVDAIVDVLLVCLGLHGLGLDELLVSPIALGGGTARTSHGELAIPGPAVVQLLAGCDLVAIGGPFDVELATPTGVALLAEWATASGPLPATRVHSIGVGAGSRRFPDRANVLRLVLADRIAGEGTGDALLLETNVDDLEPRLWPGVIDALLAAGASDAWLTPILMKKGRPAHTLSVLTPASHAALVRATVFAETTAIGLREQTVTKVALERRSAVVTVRGHEIRVKVALDGGKVVNAQPEWEDVRAAATAEAVPAKTLLAEAVAAAAGLSL